MMTVNDNSRMIQLTMEQRDISVQTSEMLVFSPNQQ